MSIQQPIAPMGMPQMAVPAIEIPGGIQQVGEALIPTINNPVVAPQMVAPVSAGYISSIYSSLDDFSAANRYISTVCARDLWTNTWSIPRMKMKLSKALLLMDSATSSSYSGMAAGSFLNPLLGGMLYENNLTLLQTNQY